VATKARAISSFMKSNVR